MAESDLSTLLQLLQQQQPTVSTISVKLPEFWTKSPEVWFARVEAQFNTRGISQDQTKYDYVVSSLDINTAEEMQAVLTNPPDDEKYKTLKSALIQTFGKSQLQKDFELLNLSGIGDRRPTALLRKINALNDDPKTLKRALFLSNLPADIKCILASQNFSDLDQLALAADRIWETKSTTAVSAIVNQTISGGAQSMSEGGFAASSGGATFESGSQLPNIDAINKRYRPNQHQRNGPAPVNSQRFVCFYHTKFGPKARRCQPGCSFALPSGNVKASS